MNDRQRHILAVTVAVAVPVAIIILVLSGVLAPDGPQCGTGQDVHPC
ncbi:hypothetical protein OG871_04485 [Kitasatospora sp. NBC_00374]